MTSEKAPIAILGAGGHGQVIANILRLSPSTADRTLVFLDDEEGVIGSQRMGIPIAGSIAQLAEIEHAGVVIGIGNNRVRCRIAQSLAAAGEAFATAIHPSAVVAPRVMIGAGTVIDANTVISTGATIGSHVIINTGCIVNHHNHVADFVHAAPGANIGGDVTIEEGAFIGIGAIVMPQRHVGAWATVGAGALVHRDVPSGLVVVGIPARALNPAREQPKSLQSSD